MHQLARIAGAVTLGYGVAIVVSPKLMATPCELTERDGSVPRSAATLIRALGVRDTLSGLSLMLAPTGKPLRLAGMIRAGSDFGDAAVLGTTLPTTRARLKAASVAFGWGVLCTVAVAAANSR